MTSSESEEQAPSRKRSRTSNSGEDGGAGGKKARGRPRVDTQDATAADRRRTQIRLAQRAYRQRKETTISSLKSQSSQLHSIVEEMNKTFLHLNESALKSGLLQSNPTLAQEFKLVTDIFTSLVKTASEGQYDVDDEHEEAGDPTADETKSTAQRPQNHPPLGIEPQHVGWGYSATIPPGKADPVQQTHTQPDNYFTHLAGAYGQSSTTNSLVRRRQFTIGDVLDQSRSSQVSSHEQPDYTALQQPLQLPFGLVDLLNSQQSPLTPPKPHIQSVGIPTPEVTPATTRLSTPHLQLPNPISTETPTPMTTYSFNETTFARRLSRAAIETGFQLLSVANIRPAAVGYVFKLSLPYVTVDRLRAKFKIMLSRSVNEDLDWWETPFIHLGGAGTHYPRRDASGHIIPIKNSWTVRQIGPLEKKMARLESVADGRWEDLDVDLSGFEGEWFDAHDVQGYLEEQYACILDPKSSFSECLVEEKDNVTWNMSGLLPQYDLTPRRASYEDSNSPSLTHSSASTSSSSSASVTPPINTFNLPDMSFSHTRTPNYPADFSKLVNYDISFDQTLGLDLAPGFDYGFAGGGGWSGDVDLGLDMVGQNVESLPVVRQKRKKSAWVDTNKLIEGI